jgi:hypothetical protein
MKAKKSKKSNKIISKFNKSKIFQLKIIVPVVIIAVVAVIGVHQLTKSHAEACYSDPIYYGGFFGTRTFYPGQFCLVYGSTEAAFQSDGNFVVYRYGTAIWQSHTYGIYAHLLAFQSDGNVVIYNIYGQPVWQTVTYGHAGAIYYQFDATDWNPHGLWIDLYDGASGEWDFIWRN